MKLTPTRLIAAAAAGSLAVVSLAGPLNPPAGPVSPTMKTLTEVEPRIAVNAANTPGDVPGTFKLASPGSYYLAGNIDAITISITADDVTLDLNGFRVSGGGIVAGTRARVVVRNGSVVNSQYYGVSLDSCTDSLVENVRVSNTGRSGIYIGTRGVARHCQVSEGGLPGQGGSGGFYAREDSRLEDCTAVNCSPAGFGGAVGTQYTRCTAAHNLGDGFTSGWMLDSCIADQNTGRGFVSVQQAVDCRASGNSGDGFIINGQAERCVASNNGGLGYVASEGAVLRGCRADNNTHQGFHAVGEFVWLSSCTAYSNGGASQAGIWISNDRCRVEDCQCTRNGYGIYIDVGTTAGVFMHNLCSANAAGNYSSIPANNSFAPLVNSPGQNNFSTTTPLSNIAH